jgi:ZIP family zinc transporter
MVAPDLPAWVLASGLGALVSASLVLGAAVGLYAPLRHRWFTAAMAAAAGISIAAASLDLIASAARANGAWRSGVAFILGAAAYSLANAWPALRQARHRKRCGECIQQPTEAGAPGSGLAIAVGTLIDAVPEGVALGLETSRIGAPGLGLLAAFALGNFAEAMSSASGMSIAGRSTRYIFGLWILSAVLVTCLAGLSAALSAMAPRGTESMCNAFVAGALIAMVVETMIPEAAHDSAPLNGLIAAIGFFMLLILLGTG